MPKQTNFQQRDVNDLAAMMRVNDSADGKRMVDTIRANVSRFDIEARTEADPQRAHWIQGAAQALDSLADCIEHSRATLKSIEEQNAKNLRMKELCTEGMIGR